jgi:hypothetical protein
MGIYGDGMSILCRNSLFYLRFPTLLMETMSDLLLLFLRRRFKVARVGIYSG